MKTPENTFKTALKNRQTQLGMWLTMANTTSTEICASAGFDWVLIDVEHSPNTLQTVLTQLQTVAGYPGCHAAVRVPIGDSTMIKQFLDLGAQTLLIPMVETADQAAQLVAACRYPPQGFRGVGGARASRWGLYANYAKEANEQVCVLVQIETLKGLENLEAIAAVEGVDGVFIGPADLSASMGHIGNSGHPEVQATIHQMIARILAAGKAPGILTFSDALNEAYIKQGAVFVALGTDSSLLSRTSVALVTKFRGLEHGSDKSDSAKDSVAAAPQAVSY